MDNEKEKNINNGVSLSRKFNSTDLIGSISCSPNGKFIAFSTHIGAIKIISLETDATTTLIDNTGEVNGLSWSPDNKFIAFSSTDKAVRIVNSTTGKIYRTYQSQKKSPFCISFSPDGNLIAWGASNNTIEIRGVSEKYNNTLKGHRAPINNLAWSNDSKILASCSDDNSIMLYNIMKPNSPKTLTSHFSNVYNIVWSPNKKTLVSSSNDNTIRFWNPKNGRMLGVLEGHTGSVICIAFSPDGKFLASMSFDNTIRIWRCDIWETVAYFKHDTKKTKYFQRLYFHPDKPLLFTVQDKFINVWNIDFEQFYETKDETKSVHYTNAKVVLIGDSGVGKTGLGLALSKQPFRPTESTHARHVWTFETKNIELNNGRIETRETLLWDLAGQPGYRLIHQLHLTELAVALVVCDARSESDPFSGVFHWIRALKQAQQGLSSSANIKKILVLARSDRGGIGVSKARLDNVLEKLEFDDFVETSAKEGWGIDQLIYKIKKSIPWNALPKVSSTELFQEIKAFLIEEKISGHLLSTAEDLYRSFIRVKKISADNLDLHDKFNTCIDLVESRGLIKKFSFGKLVLLQPELLDSYASVIVNAAKQEPDGLGFIIDDESSIKKFRIPSDERVKDDELEKLLIIATVEDLLRHEIVLREYAEDGPYLIFPSQVTREHSGIDEIKGREVIFSFEGPVLNVYSTLTVRLAHSGQFFKNEIWKNAVIYNTFSGEQCGIFLKEIEEGRGEITLFFNDDARNETRMQFEQFVDHHLNKRTVPNSVKRKKIFICSSCDTPVSDLQVIRRRERGHDSLNCNVCENKIFIREQANLSNKKIYTPEMDRIADTRRDVEAATSVLKGKVATDDYDVFLCYNSNDKELVKDIGEKLKERGLLPWLDIWELRPGFPWQSLLEEQIQNIKSVAIFVGEDGFGPWQDHEINSFIRQFVKRQLPVIPVILQSCNTNPKLPVFLEGMSWVDYRKKDSNPLGNLLWGITGEKSNVELAY